MGRQVQFKQARATVNKQKKKVILSYIRDNWDVVIEASLGMIRGFGFFKRLKICVSIMRGRKKAVNGDE